MLSSFPLSTGLVFFLFLLPSIDALYVRTIDPSDYNTFLHETGFIGPPPNSYRVSGSLILPDPADLCSDPPSGSSNNYTAAIVLIVRGNCTFYQKALRAQQLGAVGAVIGNNYPEYPERWIRMSMGDDEGNKTEVIIPTVYVPTYTYIRLQNYIIDNVNDTFGNPPSPLFAVLDSRGEFSGDDDYPSAEQFRMTALLLLILPAVWIMIASFYVLRRMCRQRVLARKRERKLKKLPIIEFHKELLMNEAEIKADAEEKKQRRLSNQQKGDRNEESPAASAGRGEDSKINLVIDPLTAEDRAARGDTAHQLLSYDAPVHDQHSSALSAATSPTTTSISLRPPQSPRNGKTAVKKGRIINDQCSICLDEFTEGSEIKLLPCRHAYHTACIDEWLTRSEHCPIDRESILDETSSSCCCC